MLRKGRLAITVFETIAKKGDIYKQIAKERTVRVEGDSDRAGLHAQVTSNVADSATVCERHFLIQNDQLNEYSTDPFVEEITVDSAMGLVQKFVSGQDVDPRLYDSMSKTQSGSVETLTLRIAALQSKGSKSKGRTSNVSSLTVEGGRSESGAPKGRSGDPDHELMKPLYHEEMLRIPYDAAVDFASLLQKVVRLKAQGSSSEITAFFEQECPRLVPHTKSVGVLLPQQKGHPGGRTVLRRQGGDGAVRAFAERQMSRFLERASATTNRPQADCRTFASQFGNSVKTNNVKGFRTATPKVVLAQADELLANITVMNELKLEDHIVDILEEGSFLSKDQADAIKAQEYDDVEDNDEDLSEDEREGDRNTTTGHNEQVPATRQAAMTGAAPLPTTGNPPAASAATAGRPRTQASTKAQNAQSQARKAKAKRSRKAADESDGSEASDGEGVEAQHDDNQTYNHRVLTPQELARQQRGQAYVEATIVQRQGGLPRTTTVLDTVETRAAEQHMLRRIAECQKTEEGRKHLAALLDKPSSSTQVPGEKRNLGDILEHGILADDERQEPQEGQENAPPKRHRPASASGIAGAALKGKQTGVMNTGQTDQSKPGKKQADKNIGGGGRKLRDRN